MPRAVRQLLVRPPWPLWRLVEAMFLLSWLLTQYHFHVQLSDQLSKAMVRIESLEERMKPRDQARTLEYPGFNQQYNRVRSRQQRATEQEHLNKLWERIARLETRMMTPPSNFSTSDRGFSCSQCTPGKTGLPGKNGMPGRDGKDGLPGRDGRDGTDGRNGIPGIHGIPGRQGLPGRDGATGSKGKRGHKGDKGTQGPQGPPGDPIMYHKEPTSTPPTEESQGSAVYIRWGRSVCPPDRGTVLVYKGRVAGWRPKLQREGGSKYLCMPLTPLYSKPPTGSETGAPLYGVEYGQVEDLFSRIPGKDRQISYRSVPCAVCRVERRGSMMMIPARNVCPSRLWTREYHGYLMTDTSNSSSPEYICVDADASGVNELHTTQRASKALLTSVRGQCGVLPCPNYRQDWELTCAVCTM